MQKGTAPYHVDRQGVHIIFDEVIAWLCPQCGEAYFEEKEVDAIQQVIKAVQKQSTSLAKSA